MNLILELWRDRAPNWGGRSVTDGWIGRQTDGQIDGQTNDSNSSRLCQQWGLSFIEAPNSSLLWIPDVHHGCQITGAIITAFIFIDF